MIIYADIDGTICSDESGLYEKVKPIKEQINKINKLYDEGNTIIYWTARGTVTGINWFDLTKNQLLSAGAKFTGLDVGNKPHFDILIDDKAIQAESYFLMQEKT